MTWLAHLWNRPGPNCIAADERDVWASAQSLADLGELTARWLEGDLQSQPGYYGSVDVDEDDAVGLTAALAALNRAGLVTDNSQAGHVGIGWDGAHWRSRAAVTGFAAAETVQHLRDTLTGLRQPYYLIASERPRLPYRWRRQGGLPVTWREDVPTCWFGNTLSRSDLDFSYDGVGSGALVELHAALQVAVIDLTCGRNDLWEVLYAWAETRMS